jgi:hypothetical protein
VSALYRPPLIGRLLGRRYGDRFNKWPVYARLIFALFGWWRFQWSPRRKELCTPIFAIESLKAYRDPYTGLTDTGICLYWCPTIPVEGMKYFRFEHQWIKKVGA